MHNTILPRILFAVQTGTWNGELVLSLENICSSQHLRHM